MQVIMKKCPRCNSIVEDSTFCKVCGETITYESINTSNREVIANNRWGHIYRLKILIIPIIVTIISGICMLISMTFNINSVFSIICIVACYICSIKKYKISKLLQYKYNKEYAELNANICILVIGLIAIIFSIMSMLKTI